MAASNTSGVLLKAEEPKVIKIPNFSKLKAGYVEGGLYLQDAALKTIVVRVFPCGRKDSATKDYVSILLRKQWLRSFPLNFHCTVSVLDNCGGRNYSQTCGMEELERDFKIDEFVKRSTLFENDFELLPNDTLTVLCEVSYTMPSSQRSSKIWSVLSRLYAWYPPKRGDLREKQEKKGMCSLIVETMDGGEFLLPTPLSYFGIETEVISKSSEEKSSKNNQESVKNILLSVSQLNSVDEVNKKLDNSSSMVDTSMPFLANNIQAKSLDRNSVDKVNKQSDNSSCMVNTSTLSLPNNIQTAVLKSEPKQDSITDVKKDITSLLSGIKLASGKKDKSELISAITAVLSNTNLSTDNTGKRAKNSIPACASGSKDTTPSSLNSKTLFETGYKNKTLSEIPVSDLAMFSKSRTPDVKINTSNSGDKFKRIKPKSETTAASNTKLLDFGSRKTVQGSDICDASPVFVRMLKTPMLENSTKRVKLQNIDTDTFDNFLYYLETREIIAENFEKLCHLYDMADQYEVVSLMWDCSQRLAQFLDVQNFLIVLKLADMHSDEKLMKKLQKFCLQNEKAVLSSLINDPEFLKWYRSWKKEDISSNMDISDDEIEVCDNDLDFYR